MQRAPLVSHSPEMEAHIMQKYQRVRATHLPQIPGWRIWGGGRTSSWRFESPCPSFTVHLPTTETGTSTHKARAGPWKIPPLKNPYHGSFLRVFPERDFAPHTSKKNMKKCSCFSRMCTSHWFLPSACWTRKRGCPIFKWFLRSLWYQVGEIFLCASDWIML